VRTPAAAAALRQTLLCDSRARRSVAGFPPRRRPTRARRVTDSGLHVLRRRAAERCLRSGVRRAWRDGPERHK
jgi:hypothetical protein